MVRLDLPWWTFPAIDRVESFLASKAGRARVFEYGAGASTVWLAKRSASVSSVEHDPGFAQTIRGIIAPHANVGLRVVEPSKASASTIARSNRKGYAKKSFDEYVSSIDAEDGAFDLIVIDGRARASCLGRAVSRLSANGIILFDDSHRQEYRRAIESCSLREQVLRGFAPTVPFRCQTSLLLSGS
jgi:predicted O-methyltransferase YrrM